MNYVTERDMIRKDKEVFAKLWGDKPSAYAVGGYHGGRLPVREWNETIAKLDPENMTLEEIRKLKGLEYYRPLFCYECGSDVKKAAEVSPDIYFCRDCLASTVGVLDGMEG